jgi:hypothetical protein
MTELNPALDRDMHLMLLTLLGAAFVESFPVGGRSSRQVGFARC